MKKNKPYIITNKILLFGLILFLIWFTFCLPKPLFQSPTSTVIVDENHDLLGAKIADDGQWRFPHSDDVPEKFKIAIITYEDQYFYKHLGVNPVAIVHAAKTNIKAKSIKRGGSTISQQTIRLARNNPKRTYVEKAKEAMMAIRLELGYSKSKILSYYASNAPFGGNVVGIHAASWRYFGRDIQDISWAEAATLAVLPNSPGLIHPGRNRQELKEKRDALLLRLLEKKNIDTFTYEIAIQEPLPEEPHALPRHAPHLTERVNQQYSGDMIVTSIDKQWQLQANRIVTSHQSQLSQNQIHNTAAIIIDVKSRTVKAYVGNSSSNSENQNQVDCIISPRSTGSTLKPFLYAAALDDGLFLPKSLVADVPTYYNNYTPKNFSESFSGAVPANSALAKSLNIPAVRLLDEYGIPKFHSVLQDLELNDIKYKASHYGLPLILGGAESSLWDLTRAYTGMASTLTHFNENEGLYFRGEFQTLSYLKEEESPILKPNKQQEVFSASSIWHTMNALVEAKRPGKEKAWEYYSNSQKVAWKTGTSFGNKDAWAIGVSPNYVVGVWVGNADGEGRTGNTGLATAAPILFDLFDILPPSNEWFAPPVQELYTTEVCRLSGQLAKPSCTEIVTEYVSELGLETKACSYHQLVTTNLTGEYQVNLNCMEKELVKQKSYFVLPPKQAMYFSKQNISYTDLPPFHPNCVGNNDETFSIIYPQAQAEVSIPQNIKGDEESIVAKVATKNRDMKLYWYLDDQFLGTTKTIHQMELNPNLGKHVLGIMNTEGVQMFQVFYVK